MDWDQSTDLQGMETVTEMATGLTVTAMDSTVTEMVSFAYNLKTQTYYNLVI